MKSMKEQRWMDSVNRDMKAIGTREDEVHERTEMDGQCQPRHESYRLKKR